MACARTARPLLGLNDEECVPIVLLVVTVCGSLLTTYLRICYDDGAKVCTAPLFWY